MPWSKPEPTVPVCDYAGPVDAQAQRNAIHSGEPDASTRELLARETCFILGKEPETYERLRKDKSEPLRFAGLAFSGGGIRSATFNLGVLQAIAGEGLLGHFRYLSTVSGGGFIGSALTWWLGAGNPRGAAGAKARTFSTDAAGFPYGCADPTSATASRLQHRLLTFLREHGEYITPGGGITLVTGIASVLRGMFLNAWALFPVLAALMYFANRAIGALELPQSQWWNPVIGVPLLVPIILAAGFTVLAAIYSLATAFDTGLPVHYRIRREFEKATGRLLLWTVILCIVLSPPLTSLALAGWLQSVGPAAALVGVVSLLRSVRPSAKPGEGVLSTGMGAIVGAFLFIYGVWLTGYFAGTAIYLLVPTAVTHLACSHCQAVLPSIGDAAREAFAAWAGQHWPLSWALPAIGWDGVVIAAGLAWGALFGLVVNINHLGVHRYYRDRLMEAYMPDFDLMQTYEVEPATKAERRRFTSVLSPPARGKKLAQPYPLINTNMVLVKTKDRIRENRGGDSFVLSPLYCGSNATGWQSSREFMGGTLTLPTAMAISGAAVNPGAGVAGTGPTRNRLVSWAMAWLNIRLGFWAPNPCKRFRFTLTPNHLVPGLLAELLFWTGYRERSTFVQLTDGGHFENLAVYELVRRRASLIWCCDAGEDKDFTFDDLLNLLRRIETDFGARIEFAGADNQPAALAFRRDPETRRVAEFAPKGFLVGRIVYADKSEGTLIYVKATLIAKLRPEVLEYHAANPEFPDQSTADQWFDPDQFEAYRELGYALAKNALASAKVGRKSLTELIGSFDRT